MGWNVPPSHPYGAVSDVWIDFFMLFYSHHTFFFLHKSNRFTYKIFYDFIKINRFRRQQKIRMIINRRICLKIVINGLLIYETSFFKIDLPLLMNKLNFIGSNDELT